MAHLAGLEFPDHTGLAPLADPRTGPDGRPLRLRVTGASALVPEVLTVTGLGHLLAPDEASPGRGEG